MFRDISRGVLILFGFLILLAVIAAGGLAWRYYTAEVRGVVGAEERIESAPFRMSAYDHFFDLCASVQAYEGRLDAQIAQLEELQESNNASERDIMRVTTNIAGLRGQRIAAIHSYNADARKDYTIGQFRDSGLPYTLNADPYEGEKTSCN